MILHGKDVLVYAGSTVVAAAKSCTIHVKAGLIGVSDPIQGTWESSICGLKSWTVSVNGLFSAQSGEMAGTFSNILLWPGQSFILSCKIVDGSTAATALSGPVICEDAEAAGGVHHLATYNVTFRGTGELAEP